MELWETNRTRKKKPKLGRGYCHSCDRALVGDGSKCPVCGNRNKGDLKRQRSSADRAMES